MDIDIPFLILNFEATHTPLWPPVPDDFLYETHGTVVSLDESEQETLVGRFRLYYADVDSAAAERFDAYEVLDSHSEATAEYLEFVYEPAEQNSAKGC